MLADPGKSESEYLAGLLKIISGNTYDLIIPLEESSIRIILKNKEKIQKYTRFVLPTENDFESANNKWNVMQLADTLRIPHPLTFAPENEKEIEEAIRTIGFPLIIKPKLSSGSRGLKKINSKEEFQKHYPSIKNKYGYPLLQECIDSSGQGLGVGLLFEHGKLVTSYSYKRLREFPVHGGPSTLRETTNQPDLIQQAVRLLESLHWNGVAMVEFKNDPASNIPKLLEINPRFWGSLELAHSAGLNFPYLMYCVSAGLPFTHTAPQIGIQCRWLFPGDIAHFISNRKRFSLRPSFFQFTGKHLHYDDFKSYDWKGNLAIIVCTFFSIFDLQTWKLGIFRT